MEADVTKRLQTDPNAQAEKESIDAIKATLLSIHPQKKMLVSTLKNALSTMASVVAQNPENALAYFEQEAAKVRAELAADSDNDELKLQQEEVEAAQVQHVYREFNASADALANEAIDRFDPRTHVGGIVVDRQWSDGDLSSLRYVDDEGDIVMP